MSSGERVEEWLRDVPGAGVSGAGVSGMAPSDLLDPTSRGNSVYVDHDAVLQRRLRQHPVSATQARTAGFEFARAARLLAATPERTTALLEEQLDPMELFKQDFCQQRGLHVRHTVGDHQLRIESELSKFAAHPQRSQDPRCVMSKEGRYTVRLLEDCMTWEGWLGCPFSPASGVEGPSDRVAMEDVGAFLRDVDRNTALRYYGSYVNAVHFSPQNSLCAVYHLDGVDRHYVCMVFVNVGYMTHDTAPASTKAFSLEPPVNSESEAFLTKEKPLPGVLVGRPVYYFYFLCQCLPMRLRGSS